MTTISIKQLHDETGMWIREAEKSPITVTNRGQIIATLSPYVPLSAESHASILKTAGTTRRKTKS